MRRHSYACELLRAFDSTLLSGMECSCPWDHDDVCANCNATYAEHRHIDNRCPPDTDGEIDHKSAWRATTFKAKE